MALASLVCLLVLSISLGCFSFPYSIAVQAVTSLLVLVPGVVLAVCTVYWLRKSQKLMSANQPPAAPNEEEPPIHLELPTANPLPRSSLSRSYTGFRVLPSQLVLQPSATSPSHSDLPLAAPSSSSVLFAISPPPSPSHPHSHPHPHSHLALLSDSSFEPPAGTHEHERQRVSDAPTSASASASPSSSSLLLPSSSQIQLAQTLMISPSASSNSANFPSLPSLVHSGNHPIAVPPPAPPSPSPSPFASPLASGSPHPRVRSSSIHAHDSTPGAAPSLSPPRVLTGGTSSPPSLSPSPALFRSPLASHLRSDPSAALPGMSPPQLIDDSQAVALALAGGPNRSQKTWSSSVPADAAISHTRSLGSIEADAAGRCAVAAIACEGEK